ncbi:stress-induced-phosphoprotein 1 [Eurytemora carolleeae]|uniref:stress-induced-phosphoprotein 1 n=1 Tax=Eurytemora carolleeae TaxID=1294199 RepID=UPI000C77A1C6|nr:stress-induced-phosphoprotein 1 [Eurytemora carolleeae]|eukprot:XP_023337984.1 stress-induced-phosphoprotein 1-like [Eurytemora affinis]
MDVEGALKEKELGNQAYKKKDFQTAIKHYTKAIELDNTELTFHNNLAAVYFEMKEYDKTIKECETAIEVGRENRADFKLIAKAYNRLATAHKKLGDLQAAKVGYEKALTEHRTPEYRQNLSEVESEIKKAAELAYINPELADQEKQKGNESFKKGQWADAVKFYSEAIKRNPKDSRIYSNRAACYTKLTAFDLALKDCDKSIELDPVFVKAYLRKGNVLKAMGQIQKAMDVYSKAMELDPDSAEAKTGYKDCAVRQYSTGGGDPEKTRERAMNDPEVQQIMGDPAMRMILEQMQSDPQAVSEHLKNPEIMKKIMKLKDSGLISMQYR